MEARLAAKASGNAHQQTVGDAVARVMVDCCYEYCETGGYGHGVIK